MQNALHFGDCLGVMKKMDSESIDVIYLDPPFNSNAVYNVGFASAGDASAQIHAFDDTWKWTHETSANFDFLVSEGGLPDLAAEALSAVRTLAKESPLTAYMTMMAPRLVEIHRLVKKTGSVYLHCDPTASHYLKVMMDAIFGPKSFRNEIIWKRTGGHAPRKSFGPLHDTILFYTKSESGYYFKPLKGPYTRDHVKTRYSQLPDGRLKFTSGGNILTGANVSRGESGKPWRGVDPSKKNRHWAVPGFIADQMPEGFRDLGTIDQLEAAFQAGLIEFIPGRAWPEPVRYLEDDAGSALGDIWAYQPGTAGILHGTEDEIDSDVAYLGPTSPERLGYPTQKPTGLLERIIRASCPPGGVVMDPFCGCGTTIAAAQNLGLSWIGIDITFIAVDLIINRIRTTYGDEVADAIDVQGIPEDLAGARKLFERDPFEFERWAVSLVKGTPNQKQVGDRGIDGIIRYYKGRKTKPGQLVVSVKGGKQLNPGMVRDLQGTVANNAKYDGGILITMWDTTRGMREAANGAGVWLDPAGTAHAKIQLITVPELLAGKRIDVPLIVPPYTEARPISETSEQMLIDFDA